MAAVAVGSAADRVSPKLLLLAMALLRSVAQVPAAIGGGLAVLVASRVFLGAAEGGPPSPSPNRPRRPGTPTTGATFPVR
ncbi:hypothetical protein ABTX77_12985 [Streptomyces sp. NPDC097704]|uniref:hypothetical protein n=1 Tax=Streptomyces sp. NPDC097704 TaxID=3157101 RepID=UPI00331B3A7F